MFEYFEETYGPVDKEISFYCGEAAGRPESGERKRDFSADDKHFAANCGLKFEVPETVFLDNNWLTK